MNETSRRRPSRVAVEVNTMKIVIGLVVATQICSIVVCSTVTTHYSSNLSNLSDTQIHQFALDEQEANHVPVLKSIKTRRVLSLDGNYDFCFDRQREGFSQNWSSSALSSQCPHEALFQMPVPSAFNHVPSLAWASQYIGWFWYQKTFALNLADYRQHHQDQWPQYWPMLHFENVNYLALVWLQRLDDGTSHFLGAHVGGHLPFMFNATRYLLTSDLAGHLPAAATHARFRLTVAVSNRLDEETTIPGGRMIDLGHETGHHYEQFQPQFDFFHFAGILGSIQLVSLPRLHIASVEQVSSETRTGYGGLASSQQPVLLVCLAGDYEALSRAFTWQATVYDAHDESRLIGQGSADALTEDGLCHRLTLELVGGERSFRNWSLAMGDLNHQAHLYLVSVHLFGLQAVVDTYEVSMGFNGGPKAAQNLQLQGFGLHHEQPISGRTMSPAAIMKDIYLLKQMGVNLVRTSHYPYSVGFLDACDQHGLLVVAESPAVGLQSFGEQKLRLHKQLLLEMMERDHHHPSILMWSLANEPASELPEAKPYFEALTNFANLELASYTRLARRPITAAIAQPPTTDLVGELLDVVMVNRYMGWYEASGVLEAVRRPFLEGLCQWARRLGPKKPLLISEFGAEAMPGLHRWSPTGLEDIYSEEYQRDLLLEHEQLFDELWAARAAAPERGFKGKTSAKFNCSSPINFMGAMIWNFADFSTHQSLTRIGSINHKGIFTREREPKLAARAIRQIYLDRIKSSGAN